MSSFKKALGEKNPNKIVEEMIRQKIDNLYGKCEDKREERYGLHASAIIASDAEFCLRAQVLSLFFKQNQGKDLPIKTRKIFKHGNTIHEEVYEVLKKEPGIVIDCEETRFIPEYDLNYTIDLNLNLLNKEWVVDVKSMNGFAFDKATSHPTGEKQVLFYLFCHKKKHGFVLAYNKNTSDIKIFIVKYDKEKVRPYVDRLKEIQVCKNEYLQSKSLPDRKCKKCDSKLATTCAMRDACWKIGMGRVKLEKR